MQHITNSDELNSAIVLLETEQAVQKALLKEQVLLAFEALRPVNIVKNSLQNLTTPNDITSDIIGSTIGLASGFITRKLIVRGSAHVGRKILGYLAQRGIKTLITNNAQTVKRIGAVIALSLFRKKKERNAIYS